MANSRVHRQGWRPSLLLLCIAVSLSGCCRSRTDHRIKADQSAYSAIREKNTDPRWCEPELDIQQDPRSRFFDPFDADRPPMPQDDASSHAYMHCVDGKKGWKHWHDNGNVADLENPGWRESLPRYVEVTEDGKVKLTLETALQLAYLHSPAHQAQLETLYLSALDVTTERFRLDTQFTGGLDTVFNVNGKDRPGGSSSTLSVGRGDGVGLGPTSLQASRRLATAGTIVTSVANSFVWEFSGGDTNFAGSILSAGFVQPLLRGAGRDIALEQLTIVERALLANIRAYHQYRQGFYTNVAIGDLGVAGPQRRGGFFGGTGLTGFTGQGAGGFGGVGNATFGGDRGGGGGGNGGTGNGFAGGGAGTVGGFIGLLQQTQQVRNTENSLGLQLRTLSLLEAHRDAGVIDLNQVDQFRQSIETERATLLQNQNGLLFATEGFIVGTLGLPSDLPVELDDTLVEQFQFVGPDASRLQDQISEIQDRVGQLSEQPNQEEIERIISIILTLRDAVREQLEAVKADLIRMEDVAPQRNRGLTDVEQRLEKDDRDQLRTAFKELEAEFAELAITIDSINAGQNAEQSDATVSKVVKWLGEAYRIAQGSILVQARARLDAITVERIDLNPDDAVAIALQNRLDFMNNRAALVDSWRLIAFNADALQGNLSVSLGGDLRTSGDNPTRFDGRNATARAGVQVDAPFQRLLERNNYRQSLITYQAGRRGFIQAQDGLKFGLRASLRNLDQLRQNLEIQRRAVAISIRRVDLTRENLNAPVAPPVPGQPPARLGPTAATSLLTALSDLRTTQNNFMSVWLNYEASRMRLARDLGLMQLDENGRWIDTPIPSSVPTVEQDEFTDLLPEVPEEWIALAEKIPEEHAELPEQ